MQWTIPPAVLATHAALARAGCAAWLVGGCVRDALRGAPVRDWDLCVAAAKDAVLAALPRAIPIGGAHGTLMTPTPDGPVDVTPLRAETLARDLARRDFTVNALAFDPVRGELHDPCGGARDLARGVLRACEDARARLSEDPLRALRAARLTAELALEPDAELRAVLPAFADAIAQGLAAERVRAELDRLLSTPRAAHGVALLRETGLEAALIPGARADASAVLAQLVDANAREESAAPSKSTPHAAEHPRKNERARTHPSRELDAPDGDTRDANEHARADASREADARNSDERARESNGETHTASATEHSRDDDERARAHTAREPDARALPLRDLRLAAWLRGANAQAVLARWRFPKRRARDVERVLLLHPVDRARADDPTRLRKLRKRARRDALLDAALALRRAELAAYGGGPETSARFDALCAQLARIRRDPVQNRRLALGGREVCETLGIAPGPTVGRALRYLGARVLENPARNTPDALREMLRAWHAARDR